MSGSTVRTGRSSTEDAAKAEAGAGVEVAVGAIPSPSAASVPLGCGPIPASSAGVAMVTSLGLRSSHGTRGLHCETIATVLR